MANFGFPRSPGSPLTVPSGERDSLAGSIVRNAPSPDCKAFGSISAIVQDAVTVAAVPTLPSPFVELPDAVVVEIFRFIPFVDRMKMLSRVCRHWERLVFSEILCEECDFRRGFASHEEVSEYLSRIVRAAHAAKRSSPVQRLGIFLDNDPAGFPYLTRIASLCPSLTELYIDPLMPHGDFDRRLVTLLGGPMRLRKLEMVFSASYRLDRLQSIHLPRTVSSLSIRGSESVFLYWWDVMAVLRQHAGRLIKLEIDLIPQYLSRDIFGEICTRQPKLRCLSVHVDSRTEEWAQCVGTQIGSFKRMEQLTISGLWLQHTRQALASLARTSLRLLKLEHVRGLRQLFFHDAPVLEWVFFEDLDLDVASFSKCPKLRCLSVIENELSPVSAANNPANAAAAAAAAAAGGVGGVAAAVAVGFGAVVPVAGPPAGAAPVAAAPGPTAPAGGNGETERENASGARALRVSCVDCPELWLLKVQVRSPGEEPPRVSIANCPNLMIMDVGIVKLVEGTAFPKLQHLEMDGSRGCVFESAPYLHDVSFMCAAKHVAFDPVLLTEVLKKCFLLKRLSIESGTLCSLTVGTFPFLADLAVSDCAFAEASFLKISCPTLQSVELRGLQSQWPVACELASPNLRSVKVSACSFLDDAWLLGALANCPRLIELEITDSAAMVRPALPASIRTARFARCPRLAAVSCAAESVDISYMCCPSLASPPGPSPHAEDCRCASALSESPESPLPASVSLPPSDAVSVVLESN